MLYSSMFIKLLRIGAIGLMLCAATAWAGPASIQGMVKDAKGQPIKGANVQVASKDGKQLYNTVKTDAQGRYLSQGLQPGVYRVSLVVNGAVKASISNTKAKPDQSTELNFDLNPAETGSHMGGRWVEVDDNAASNAGALNVKRANAEQLQRQMQSMGNPNTGN